MTEVSIFRLYVMRAGYLLISFGLAIVIWPNLLNHSHVWALKYGDTSGLLAGVSVLALVGLRYPLQMIPVLLFELIWKIIWLIAIALPLWRADQLDTATRESIFACGMGVVLMPLIIPWKYVIVNYIKKKGDPWR